MKKQNLRLCLAFFVCMLSINNYAYDAKVNGVYYNFSDTEATVTYMYRGINRSAYKDSVTIPKTVDYRGKTYPVTRIGAYAFWNCIDMKEIHLPVSIQRIDSLAFQECTGLTNIAIPNSVTDIGFQAFSGCSNLTSITIPNSVEIIGDNAFSECSNLTSITIPSSVEKIGDNAFQRCDKLSNVIFHCKEIGGWFSGLTNISNVVIGDEVEIIGESAFSGCTRLTDITIPSSVTNIGQRVFYNCTGLTKITIPSSVTSIENHTFYGCSGLTSITIPNSVTSIGECAFGYCSNLTSITIPSSVEKIGDNAFQRCDKLSNVIFHCKEIGGWLSGSTTISNVVIGDEVEIIGESAFSGCTRLTDITIPSSVTNIESHAFYGCTGLTEINIPSSVTNIGRFAFSGCTNLASISIPESLASIGYRIFENTAWYNNQPDGMVYIGNVAYRYKGEMPMNTELIIKEGTLGIAKEALSYCRGLTSILIPNTVVTIGSGAFHECRSLKEIEIPNSVKTMGGDLTFAYCKSLTKVSIPNCEIMMEYNTFERVPFQDCSNLESISIDCKNPPSSLFNSVPQLKYVVLGDHVETIGAGAFASCRQITQLTIGKSVSEIKENAFTDIQKLDEVICYAENVPKTDRTVFANSFIEYATLYVPASSVEAYKSSAPWSGFKQILPLKSDTPDDAERCATPTIIYKDRKLSFECATDGVTFVTDITDTDIKKHYTATIPLTATYTINVYASKKGYKDSEIATATLCWIDATPQTEGIANNVANIQARAVLIQSSNNTFTIEGAEAGTAISVYDTSGKLVGSANANGEAATTINTSLRNGDIGIVKIGEKAIKVVMK